MPYFLHPQGFDLSQTKASPLGYKFFTSTMWRSASIYFSFEGKCAPKIITFWSKKFQKVFKNGMLDIDFQKIDCGAQFFVKTGNRVFKVLWECSESQFG